MLDSAIYRILYRDLLLDFMRLSLCDHLLVLTLVFIA
jgi:hypothetical protein